MKISDERVKALDEIGFPWAKGTSQGKSDSQPDSGAVASESAPPAASSAVPNDANTPYQWIEEFTLRMKNELSLLETKNSQLEEQRSASERAKTENVQLKRDLDEMRKQLAQQKTLHERETKALQTKCDAQSSKNDALNAQIVRDKAARYEAVKTLIASQNVSLAATSARYSVEQKHIRSELDMAKRKVDQLTTSNSRLEVANSKLKADLLNQLKSREAEEKRLKEEYANNLSAMSMAHTESVESLKDEVRTLRTSGSCLEW